MTLRETIEGYLEAPFPIWENQLTRLLVETSHSEELDLDGDSVCRWLVTSDPAAGPTYLSVPSLDNLSFYEENGLLTQSADQLTAILAIDKLRNALRVLAWEEPVNKCVIQLVRSIHVVESLDDEIDISHSDPNLPFTIFVSVCKNDSLLSRLRVAESILHEAMHLKLSLIERTLPITNPFTGHLYFSPWREEGRPAQGIVHGLFVFRTILEFFRQIKGHVDQVDGRTHLALREQQILAELGSLKNFGTCPDLTPAGATLVASLISLEY